MDLVQLGATGVIQKRSRKRKTTKYTNAPQMYPLMKKFGIEAYVSGALPGYLLVEGHNI